MYGRNFVKIHTGLYGRTASKTLKLSIAGMREYLDWNVKDPDKLGRHFTGHRTEILTEPSGEVVFNVETDDFAGRNSTYYKDRIEHSAFKNGVDAAFIKNWFAKQLERFSYGLSPDETVQLHPASKTSQSSKAWEIRATAMGLTDPSLVEKEFGKKIADKVAGKQADPIQVEIQEVMAEEAKKIHAAYAQTKRQKHFDMLREIDQIRQKYKGVYAELGKLERAEIAAMKKEMNAA